VIDLQRPPASRWRAGSRRAPTSVVENFRPGVADRLGIGYAALSAENPRLVYAAISGFGPDGPYARSARLRHGDPGPVRLHAHAGHPDEPALVRGIAADKATGFAAASAVLAALFARERTGRGQRVDVPMLDAYAAFALPDVLGPESFHPVEEQPAGMLTATNIHRTWKTADGHVVMMIVEDAQFRAICRALDREDSRARSALRRTAARLGNGVALYALLEVELAKWTTAELVERARPFGAPLAPVNGVREFMADPQVRANRTVFEVRGPRARHAATALATRALCRDPGHAAPAAAAARRAHRRGARRGGLLGSRDPRAARERRVA
jgi:crotonobetainyl-CoA:carnitine CoA-transferase CaiB-like acyl-CoA transferase